MEKEYVRVRGDVMWANFFTPNEMSGKYQFDLCNLSDAAVEALQDKLGVKAKRREDKPEKGWFITCKSVHPMKPVDADNEPLPTNTSVGNGSTAEVTVGAYSWKAPVGGKKGISPTAAKIKILAIKEYVAEGGGGGKSVADLEDDVL